MILTPAPIKTSGALLASWCIQYLLIHLRFPTIQRPSDHPAPCWPLSDPLFRHRPEFKAQSRLPTKVVLDSFFRTDSTLTHMTIQVTQLRLDSNPKFANLTQLRLNSKPKFTNLTQLWLNSFESELSQIWFTTDHILPNLGKSCWPGGGGAVECSCRLALSL